MEEAQEKEELTERDQRVELSQCYHSCLQFRPTQDHQRDVEQNSLLDDFQLYKPAANHLNAQLVH